MPPSDLSFTPFSSWHAAIHASFMSSSISNCDNGHQSKRHRHHRHAPVLSPPRRASFSSGSYFPFTKPISKVIVPESSPRRVKFVSHRICFDVLHISDYSAAEIEATWYDKKDIRAMKHKCRVDAADVSVSDYERNQMRIREECPLSVLTNLQPEATLRGLENKTSIGALRKKRHRMQAWMAVFAEQARQNMQGIMDADALADAYFEVSEPCHVAANMMAMRDARDVEWRSPADYFTEQLNGKENVIRRCDSPVTVDTFDRFEALSMAKNMGEIGISNASNLQAQKQTKMIGQ